VQDPFLQLQIAAGFFAGFLAADLSSISDPAGFKVYPFVLKRKSGSGNPFLPGSSQISA
jgi:hypothetical protein